MIDQLIASPQFQSIIGLLMETQIQSALCAVLVIILGVIVGKVLEKIILKANNTFKIGNLKASKNFGKALNMFVLIVSVIIALNYLNVDAAKAILENLAKMGPALISFLLLIFLGFIVVNLVMDLIASLLARLGAHEYLRNFGITKKALEYSMAFVKFLLFLIVLSSSMNYVGFNITTIEIIVNTLVYAIIILLGAFTFFIFKQPLENFFSGLMIEQSLLKKGERIKYKDYDGEIVGITNHGTIIKLDSGYNLIIPNRDLAKNLIFVKRVRAEIGKLEAVRLKFVAQLPSFCGPASAAMLLSFFGIEATQEEIGRIAGTKVPGGTNPNKLVETVKKVSGNQVEGAIVRHENIYNLKEEIKSWLGEGALLLMWYKKPVLFPEKKSQSGHFVLCVGIEGDELIIMDSSTQTSGVYMIDYRLMDEAMGSDHDSRMRGYIVFAKRGTSAYWRISEGLIYSEISAYKNLSKSFERYLKKTIRKNSTIYEYLAEPVSKLMREQGIKKIWGPEMEISEIKKEQKKSGKK